MPDDEAGAPANPFPGTRSREQDGRVRDIEFVEGSQVEIAYERYGSREGWPVVLTHGFPYDPRCYDEVAAQLASAGAHVVLPFMRGYGSTRYLSPLIHRSGQQAAFASDLRDLIVGLRLERPIVGGFDWGGRASCVASMLWPEMIGGLVTVGGYNVHDIAAMATTPSPPDEESRNWYQWYFHSERGRRGLDLYRSELTRQLWREWSPTWAAPDGAFERTRPSFDNSDFVATVVHSYRHRYGLAIGDPAHEASETLIARQPPIIVPTVVIDATADPLDAPLPERVHREHFPDLVGYQRVDVGHDVPQEAPESFVTAVRALHERATDSASGIVPD
ncbi:alpha/beta fold hydrolase [Microbacterium sp. BH-3-3-3]|uniref:alpha/beta fold hydrolase n=1 Tax=Microbacterium sp. BH-3-3-3 TaxID=1906742 RepID=UPI00119E57AF|nr:alpha/beta hydrolase [Microbacterium sp. BH-3-3-3]